VAAADVLAVDQEHLGIPFPVTGSRAFGPQGACVHGPRSADGTVFLGLAPVFRIDVVRNKWADVQSEHMFKASRSSRR
jgi:hypothetical protein